MISSCAFNEAENARVLINGTNYTQRFQTKQHKLRARREHGNRTHTHATIQQRFDQTTRVSRYLKKHLPTHTYEEEEGFAQTTRSALSQRALLDAIKPADNQSGPDGRLKLTASTFN